MPVGVPGQAISPSARPQRLDKTHERGLPGEMERSSSRSIDTVGEEAIGRRWAVGFFPDQVMVHMRIAP